MNNNGAALLRTGQPIPQSEIPRLSLADFRRVVIDGVGERQRGAALFGHARKGPDPVEVYAILADSARGTLRVAKTVLDCEQFPSMTPDCPQVHLFEREIAEQYRVATQNYARLKPVVFH